MSGWPDKDVALANAEQFARLGACVAMNALRRRIQWANQSEERAVLEAAIAATQREFAGPTSIAALPSCPACGRKF